MRISTLNGHDDLAEATISPAQAAEREYSDVQAALQSAIANLRVSSQNQAASDSLANALPQTIIDLLE
jgi:hypothetical protein